MSKPRIGIVALSSPVGLLELELGLQRLREAGFEPVVHPQVRDRHFVTAGTDEARAQGLLDYAFDDSIDAVWCARGGYGAGRVVNKLVEAARNVGRPKPKLLVGYSDVTTLHEYVRQAWGWKTLHAPMVVATKTTPTREEWAAVDGFVRGQPPSPYALPVKWMSEPSASVSGPLIGGNLSLWVSLAGTPWQPDPRGRILFFEDIGEALYRIDRMVVQLEQAGMLEGAAGIVLGDFTDCNDEANTMLDPSQPIGSVDWNRRVPLRPTWTLSDGLLEVFGRVARRFNISLAIGLPVGHGPNFWPLLLGARHTLAGQRLVLDQGD